VFRRYAAGEKSAADEAAIIVSQVWTALLSGAPRPPEGEALLGVIRADRLALEGVPILVSSSTEDYKMEASTSTETGASATRTTKKAAKIAARAAKIAARAAKAAEKAAAAASAPPAAPKETGERSVFRMHDDGVITFGTDEKGVMYGAENSPKKGDHTSALWRIYRSGMTVKEALAAGLTRSNIRRDRRAGNILIENPPETTAAAESGETEEDETKSENEIDEKEPENDDEDSED
jgi:hypothetical protein